MRAANTAVLGIALGLFGAALVVVALFILVNERDLLGILPLALGIIFFADGSSRLTRDYPRAKFKRRVEAMGDPAGLTLREVRRALGAERDYRKTNEGSELTWRVGRTSVTLGFDTDGTCTGIIAARGVSATSARRRS